MSHFLLGAILDDPRDLEEFMEPYFEGLELDPYLRFTKEEAIDDMFKHKYIETPFLSDELYRVKASKWYFGVNDASEDQIDEDGNIYSTYNPESKWDWYEVGGRWEGHLRLKDGSLENIAQIKDLDLSFDQEDYDKALRFWEVVVEGSKLKDGESRTDFLCFEGPDFFFKTYDDKETFAKARVWYNFYALLLDGKWCDRGQVGWFGTADLTPESVRSHEALVRKVLNDPEMQEKYIVVVDCHI